MDDVGEGAELVFEAVEVGGVDLAQHLDRHQAATLRIPRLVNRAARAFPQLAAQLEALPGAEIGGRWVSMSARPFDTSGQPGSSDAQRRGRALLTTPSSTLSGMFMPSTRCEVAVPRSL